MDIAAYVEDRAKRLHSITQNGMRALADATGVSLPQLYRLRKPDANPTLDVLKKLDLRVTRARKGQR